MRRRRTARERSERAEREAFLIDVRARCKRCREGKLNNNNNNEHKFSWNRHMEVTDKPKQTLSQFMHHTGLFTDSCCTSARRPWFSYGQSALHGAWLHIIAFRD